MLVANHIIYSLHIHYEFWPIVSENALEINDAAAVI